MPHLDSESWNPEDPFCGPHTVEAARDYGNAAASARVYLERTGRALSHRLPAARLEPDRLRIHSTPLETTPDAVIAAEAVNDGLTEEWPPASE